MVLSSSARQKFRAHIVSTSIVAALVACSAATVDQTEDLDPLTDEEVVGSISFGLKKPAGKNGDGDYCNNPNALCDIGEGDCDSNSHCSSGLACINNSGPKWGFDISIDMCAPAHCGNKVLDGDETAIDCGGSCSSPSFNCASYCVDSYWTAYPNGHGSHCSVECPCPTGQGDCDSNAECMPGNICVTKGGEKFGMPGIDVCLPATCKDGIQNAGETFPDCGGPCSSPDYDCNQVCTAYWTKYPLGHGSHCSGTCPCSSGRGDCDNDGQCTTGNVCITGNGLKFGYPGLDFCAPATCRDGIQNAGETYPDCGGPCSSPDYDCNQACTPYWTKYPVGHGSHCSGACPCPSGQGDCDNDGQCAAGNVCITNNGHKFGFPGLDFCAPPTCRNGIQDPDENGIDCGGPCSSVPCGDVCASYYANYPNGDQKHCTVACPCASGEGDCDSSAECQPGLVCGTNNARKFGFVSDGDHCVPPTCVNGILDPGETAVDCGGACGNCGQFAGLGDLPGGTFASYANAVSSRGDVIVGVSESANGREAYRWTVAGGMQPLGDLPGGIFSSTARDISDDGNVVVGRGATATSEIMAFKWTAAGGMVSLGELVGGTVRSDAYGISGNGLVIVGPSGSTKGLEAFIHSAGTMTGLGSLPGDRFRSEAWATNKDGTVVVGRALTAVGYEAFRWTQAGGMVSLGDLPGGKVDSLATGISDAGTVIAGDATTDTGVEAFRWTQAEGMVGIGVPAGMTHSYAYGISSAGDRIVGTATDATMTNNIAFLWIQGVGIRSLQEILEEQGGNTAGWIIRGATSISGDGKVIVGFGVNPDGNEEAFRAVIP